MIFLIIGVLCRIDIQLSQNWVSTVVPESLQVGGIIAKLHTTWNDYRKKLLHTTEEFSPEQIQKHLRIEEETRIHVKNFASESATKIYFVQANENF